MPEWCARLASRLPAQGWRTRFAPAPTGYLHLGHIANALFVWGVARAYGGTVILRIEDHDRGRCRPEYELALREDLDWLGFTADVATTDSYRRNPTTHFFRQSNNDARYAQAMSTLADSAEVFPCTCSRRMMAEHVPHETHVAGRELRYPGTCRDAKRDPRESPGRRVHLPSTMLAIADLRLGALHQTPSDQCGDLLIRDANANWTYQFAVTVDDYVQDIDVVIRGEDLVDSVARQWQLAGMLGRTTPPFMLHHPLLLHADGTKLSKANGDIGIRERRAAGTTAEELLGEVAYLAGLRDRADPLHVAEVPQLFRD